MIKDEGNYIITGDVGGSHITVAVVDLLERTVLDETCIRRTVSANDTAENILTAWAEAVQAVIDLTTYPIGGLALAMPGPFDYEKGISLITGLHKYEGLYGINVRKALAERLHIDADRIKFKNDAEAFLHGEVTAGAARHCKKSIGFTLGTGMGSAVSNAGITTDACWGSEPYGVSITDDYFSTRWFVKAYALLSGQRCDGVKELAELAKTDSHALSVFLSFARNFARLIAGKISLEEPEIVVIGGNIAMAHELFFDELKLQLSLYTDSTLVVKDQLGESAALLGAAMTFDLDRHVLRTL